MYYNKEIFLWIEQEIFRPINTQGENLKLTEEENSSLSQIEQTEN